MRLLCQAVLCLILASVPAWSDVLYSNGGIVGDPTVSPYDLATLSQNGVFDTFTISTESTATQVSNVGLWITSGDTPASLSWYICFSICVDENGIPFGTLGSGSNVSLSSSLVATGVQPTNGPPGTFDIYSVSFSTDILDNPNLVDLAAGTYTLELYNAIDEQCASCNIYWDVNNGPSTAYLTVTGSPAASNSFQIDGTAGPVPEPGTFGALGAGLIALSLLRRRGGK